MLREITEQPAVVGRLLDAAREVVAVAGALRRRDPAAVIFTARGSSDNAAVYGKYLIEATLGIPCGLAAPSVVTLYERPPRLRGGVVVALSQSGESPDVVEYVRAARRQGALTVGVTNAPASALAGATHHTLLLHAGPEHSVAATKTYVAQLTVLAMLVSAWAREVALERGLMGLPALLEQALALEPVARETAPRYRHMEECLVTARGYNYATALEAALKLKETCYVAAEALSAADLLHGPIAVVEHGFPVLLFALRGRALSFMQQVAARLAGLGAELITITDDEPLPGAAVTLRLPQASSGSAFPEALTPVPAIVPAQLLAYHLSVVRGVNPDVPRGLRKVTRTR
jgi:glucosamine--fructose-6-phosphate aminotransferase (isomerizing)